MKQLASQITEELKTSGYCAIYDQELERVWPTNGKRREALIAKFAKKNGWRVRHYKDGFVAIFDKAPSQLP